MEITKEFIESRPLSYSSLKEFKKSPQHYIHYISNQRSATPAMEFGSLIDCLLLTPMSLKTILCYGESRLRTTIGKDKKAKIDEQGVKIAEEHGYSRKLVNDNQLAEAKLIVQKVKDDESAGEFIKLITQTQYKLSYTDTETGLPYIGYIDGIGEKDGKPIIVELKTCQNANDEEFQGMPFH